KFHQPEFIDAGSQAPALIVIHKSVGERHSGMDCRNPGHRDVFEVTVHGLDTRFPAGMTTLVYNDESWNLGTSVKMLS
ncbi:MAG: hypothetical protein Q8L68_05655, partial [Methylococcales bacterium]|nr:hypothetical protein [Methylococcales bacterium]